MTSPARQLGRRHRRERAGAAGGVDVCQPERQRSSWFAGGLTVVVIAASVSSGQTPFRLWPSVLSVGVSAPPSHCVQIARR